MDQKKFEEFCKEKKFADYEIKTVQEILKCKNSWSPCRRTIGEDTYFVNDAFDGNEVSIKINPKELDKTYVSVYYLGDEGDSYFSEDDDGWDYNYDMVWDNDFFDGVPQAEAIFAIGEEVGVKNFEVSIGAGRNS